ncbi:MAG: DUF2284 domain-containing protein [Thermodesulfobacteriota bacterium]|nr:DUF2284 domain-containing protein [Thermodesulfobacteriota bacterium]
MKGECRKILIKDLTQFAKELEIQVVREFYPTTLIPEERIRAFCIEDKCGNYGKNYMCPPHIGSIAEMQDMLVNYSEGILFQYSKEFNVKKNRKKVEETKLDFHRIILQLENFMKEKGIFELQGLIGGSCALCGFCYAGLNKPCPSPEKARPSLESLGIDLMTLLKGLDLDTEFHSDRITWTGCILFNMI